jgi:hypothetical protein
MLGREVRLPDHLLYEVPPDEPKTTTEYAMELQDRLRVAHEALRDLQWKARSEDEDTGPKFAVGDLVYLVSHRRRKGVCKKIQAQYIGPYTVVNVYHNHTYQISYQGQTSVQHESQLKLCTEATNLVGRAPVILEPRRRLNMRGRRRRVADSDDDEFWCPTVPNITQNQNHVTPTNPTTTGSAGTELQINQQAPVTDSPVAMENGGHQHENTAETGRSTTREPILSQSRPRRECRPPAWLKDYEH